MSTTRLSLLPNPHPQLDIKTMADEDFIDDGHDALVELDDDE